MKTVKAFGPQDLRVVEAPDPVPASGEVLIAIRACGICGSCKRTKLLNKVRGKN